CRQRRGVHANTCQKSEPQRPRGALGPFHQRGMPDEADLVWGDLATACRVRFPGALSSREKPPRQRQSFALPLLCAGGKFARRDQLSRAARRLTQILQPCRMSIFSIRQFGAMILGVVANSQHAATGDRAGLSKHLEEFPEALAIESSALATKQELTVSQSYSREVSDALARGVMINHMVLGLWMHPHTTPRPLLLKLHFV